MIANHSAALDRFVNLSDAALTVLLFLLAGVAVLTALFGNTLLKAAVAAWLSLP